MSQRNQVIKAIETQYKGYRFRSRLEARWAVFFDAMKAGWEYEREGFDLGDAGLYLPDFWISPILFKDARYEGGTPQTPGLWVEIKPVPLTKSEELLCATLSDVTGHVVYALAGNVGAREFQTYKWHPSRPRFGGLCIRQELNQDMWMFEDTYHDVFLFYLCSQVVDPSKFNKDTFLGREELDVAFTAARSARFEHGEKPRF